MNDRNVYENPYLAANTGRLPHVPRLVFSFPVFVPLARALRRARVLGEPPNEGTEGYSSSTAVRNGFPPDTPERNSLGPAAMRRDGGIAGEGDRNAGGELAAPG